MNDTIESLALRVDRLTETVNEHTNLINQGRVSQGDPMFVYRPKLTTLYTSGPQSLQSENTQDLKTRTIYLLVLEGALAAYILLDRPPGFTVYGGSTSTAAVSPIDYSNTTNDRVWFRVL